MPRVLNTHNIRDGTSSSTSPKKGNPLQSGAGVFEPCLTFIDVLETLILQFFFLKIPRLPTCILLDSLRYSTISDVSEKGGGGSGNNDHGFPFSEMLNLLNRPLRASLS